VKKGLWVLAGGVGLLLCGVAAGEHLYRRVIERRYHESVAARRQLELHLGEAVVAQQRLDGALSTERRRSQELSQALAGKQTEFEQAVGRLAQEAKTVRELQMRVASMQQQMDQLQGELSLALERTGSAGTGSPAVQLERIVVSDGSAAAPQGRVLSINTEWNFLVLSLGWNAVRIGETVLIYRQDELIAKARVERVQEGVCAATILPEWRDSEVRTSDLVRLL
jgi:hypothetical protein